MHRDRRRIIFMVIGAAAALGAGLAGSRAGGLDILATAPATQAATASASGAGHPGGESWSITGGESWGITGGESWGTTG